MIILKWQIDGHQVVIPKNAVKEAQKMHTPILPAYLTADFGPTSSQPTNVFLSCFPQKLRKRVPFGDLFALNDVKMADKRKMTGRDGIVSNILKPKAFLT